MSKLLAGAALLGLAVLLACSGPTQAEVATGIPPITLAPTANTMPTVVLDPTVTPLPIIRESGGNATPGSGALTQISTADPEAFLTEVSAGERGCLEENFDSNRLPLLLSSPDLATDEEGVDLIGCMEHETLLRLFLTPFLTATGQLSVESSACIRSGFVDADLAAMTMVAEQGSGGDPEAAWTSPLTGLFVTISCLSEEEFLAASPALGMGPDDQQGLKCVLEQVGGPKGLDALTRPDTGPPDELIRATTDCNVELFARPPG